ncbi:hypothetical protein BX667DRAFT_219799, partial [Coemansia mojavensis]
MEILLNWHYLLSHSRLFVRWRLAGCLDGIGLLKKAFRSLLLGALGLTAGLASCVPFSLATSSVFTYHMGRVAGGRFSFLACSCISRSHCALLAAGITRFSSSTSRAMPKDDSCTMSISWQSSLSVMSLLLRAEASPSELPSACFACAHMSLASVLIARGMLMPSWVAVTVNLARCCALESIAWCGSSPHGPVLLDCSKLCIARPITMGVNGTTFRRCGGDGPLAFAMCFGLLDLGAGAASVAESGGVQPTISIESAHTSSSGSISMTSSSESKSDPSLSLSSPSCRRRGSNKISPSHTTNPFSSSKSPSSSSSSSS